MESKEDDQRMTAKQISAMFQIHPSTFYRNIRLGLIPRGEKVGSQAVRWRRSVIEKAFTEIGRAG